MNPAPTTTNGAPEAAASKQSASGRGALGGKAAALRRYPVGAEFDPGSGEAHFRVWAPRAVRVDVELVGPDERVTATFPLLPEPGGYFSGIGGNLRAGTLYRFRLPSGAFPDPVSRFQPTGPHGPSALIDRSYPWTDHTWRGRPASELVLYELHLGTFTHEGTWSAAVEQLPELARLGITAVEIMPVAEFPGRFGWGYDGVDLFAPSHLYGPPADARGFVDRAHGLGLMVILDVVYNHLGPDGCYLREYSTDYFTTKYQCEWGEPLNFDGENAAAVREFFLSNARYWIEEFHFDGLRLDATQQIFDASETHVLAEIAATVRAAAPGRQTFVVGENEPQQTRLLRRRGAGGYELDAAWNDDFHHSAQVVASGHTDGYYCDYRGTAQEFISAYKYGYLFQGQWSTWQGKRRGTPGPDLSPGRFVTFLQNHDQLANSLRGRRIHEFAAPALLRALTAVQLLSPSIPMLFQGQEFAASAPFLYFADHKPELAAKVAEGRTRFVRQFRRIDAPGTVEAMPDCTSAATYEQCKIDFSQRERNQPVWTLHADLLRLRRLDPVVASAARIDGAVLDRRVFVVRFFSGAGDDDRLLVVNLDTDLHYNPAPEPLLAPVADCGWKILWSSEATAYGGDGTAALETSANWQIPGPAAVLLAPNSNRESIRAKLSEKD